VISFQPDTVIPNDPNGWAAWLDGHYREHQTFIQKCRALSPSVNLPDYDIFAWKDDPKIVQQWLVAHESIHAQIRQATGISGSDLSLVDFSNEDDFISWLDGHASEHSYFRRALNVF